MSHEDEANEVHCDDGVIGGVPLAPCPFCGEGLKFTVLLEFAVEVDTGTELTAVLCRGCGVVGPADEDHIAGAVGAWNKRRSLQ